MATLQNSCLKPDNVMQKYKIARHRLMKVQLRQFESLIKQQILKKRSANDITTNNKTIKYLRNKQEQTIMDCKAKYMQPITQSIKPDQEFIAFSQSIMERFIEQESKKISALMRELNDYMKSNPNDPNLKEIEIAIYKEIVYQYEEEIIDLHTYLLHDFNAKSSFEQESEDDNIDVCLGAYIETIITAENEAKALFIQDDNIQKSSMLESFFARKIYNFVLDILSMQLGNIELLGPDGSENQKVHIVTDNGRVIKKITTSYKDAVWSTYKTCRQDLFALIRQQIDQKKQLTYNAELQPQLDLELRLLIRKHTKELNNKYNDLEKRVSKIKETNQSNTNTIETRAVDKTANQQVTTTDVVTNIPSHDDIITLKFNCIRQAFIQEYANLENETAYCNNDSFKQNELLNKFFCKKLADLETNYLKALKDHKPVSANSLMQSSTSNRILSEVTTHNSDGSIMIKKQQVIPKLPAEAGEGNIVEFLAGQSLTSSLLQLKEVLQNKPSHIFFQDSIIVNDELVNGQIDLNGTLNFAV